MSILNRLAFSGGVAALAAAVLPWGAPASAEEEPAYAGYTTTATASVVTLDIYEPTIPVPATPEMELRFAYSRAFADSTSGKGRASWMWPGDPVGEGLKVIVEQGGLPPALGKKGYPVQVNSAYPAGPETHRDEPTPGAVMRTTSADGQVIAQTGFSPDGETQDPEETDDGGLNALQQFGQVITGQQAPAEDESEGDEPTPAPPPAVPDPLKLLIDIAGYESTSKTVNSGDAVTATSRASLGGISLLGGLVTMSGIDAHSEASSDGAKGTGTGEAAYGTMRIVGQKFRFGPDGFEAGGKTNGIPGLPDEPTAALKKLGITITFPKPLREVDGDAITTTVSALEVQIDLDPLTTMLNTSKINDDVLAPIIDKIELPPDAAPLKSLLTALGNLSPRFVVTLASTSTSVDTVQGIDVPEAPPGETPPAAGGPKNGPGTGGGTTPETGGAPIPDTSGDPTTVAPDLVSSTPGLPELFSMPGMLLLAGIAAAALLGSYLRRLGLLVLGAGAACPHGLESGVPDLRKVT